MKIEIITENVKISIDTESGKVSTEKKPIAGAIDFGNNKDHAGKAQQKSITPDERELALETLREKHPVEAKKIARKIEVGAREKVLKAISGRNVAGVGVDKHTIAKMTGLDPAARVIPNALYALCNQGKIYQVKRGMWAKA